MKELEFELDNYTSCDICDKEVKELYPFGDIEICAECLFELYEDS